MLFALSFFLHQTEHVQHLINSKRYSLWKKYGLFHPHKCFYCSQINTLLTNYDVIQYSDW